VATSVCWRPGDIPGNITHAPPALACLSRRFDVLTHIMPRWPDLEAYISELEQSTICETLAAKCHSYLGSNTTQPSAAAAAGLLGKGSNFKAQRHTLMLELAAVVDFGERLRDATLLLESDGLVVLDVYDMLLEIELAMLQPSWTNTKAVSQEHHERLNASVPIGSRVSILAGKLKEDLAYAQRVVQPAIDYFTNHFGKIATAAVGDGGATAVGAATIVSTATATPAVRSADDMTHLVAFFKYARIVDPFKTWALLHVDNAWAAASDGAAVGCEKGAPLIRNLAAVFPALGNDAKLIVDLERELPKYLVETQLAQLEAGLTPEQKSSARSQWWAEHAAVLPAWAALARRVFLVVPSSAAVERVFSILRDTFGDDQKGALEDYVETALFLQYNRRPGA
jgi:hAT family C-terminal dimerisation region